MESIIEDNIRASEGAADCCATEKEPDSCEPLDQASLITVGDDG